MLLIMVKCGVFIEKYYYEVVIGGQNELGFCFGKLVEVADNLMIYKYVIKNVGKKYGKIIIFMFKFIFNDNGLGMYVYQLIWKNGEFLFWGDGYVNLSKMVFNYIGGIFKYVLVILVFFNFFINFYK